MGPVLPRRERFKTTQRKECNKEKWVLFNLFIIIYLLFVFIVICEIKLE